MDLQRDRESRWQLGVLELMSACNIITLITLITQTRALYRLVARLLGVYIYIRVIRVIRLRCFSTTNDKRRTGAEKIGEIGEID